MPYKDAHQWQQSLVSERIHNPDIEDVLILVEHPPVYTLGKGSNREFLKFNPQNHKFDLHIVERGCEVTYHGPGQLVGYPILNLQRHQPDLHWYLRQLEEVLIKVLGIYDLSGYRMPGFTGVWLNGQKVAAIGIKVSRWITMHGFALNICPNMSDFQYIIPCGIADKPVGSLAQWIPEITCQDVRPHIAQCFAEVFQLELIPAQQG